MSLTLAAKEQYIQRAIHVKYSFTATNKNTFYTATTWDDFTFAV